jgi:hypothetical protein
VAAHGEGGLHRFEALVDLDRAGHPAPAPVVGGDRQLGFLEFGDHAQKAGVGAIGVDVFEFAGKAHGRFLSGGMLVGMGRGQPVTLWAKPE